MPKDRRPPTMPNRTPAHEEEIILAEAVSRPCARSHGSTSRRPSQRAAASNTGVAAEIPLSSREPISLTEHERS